MSTYCMHISRFMTKAINNIPTLSSECGPFAVTTSHFISDGARIVAKDEMNGQEYEIVIKPIRRKEIK